VETVNQAISIYPQKTNNSGAVTDQLAHFFFVTGGLPHVPVMSGDTDTQTDSFVIWDSQVQRFIVGDLDFEVDSNGNTVNNGGNALLLAVSKSANPTTLTSADWFFYSITTSEAGVALQDYPGNPGYNADALVVTLNSFDANGNGLHSQINAISINALINGGPLTLNSTYFQTDNNTEFFMRPAIMHDAVPGGPMWFVSASSPTTEDVIRMDNVLSSAPTFTTTTLAVTPYSLAVSPLQPNGQAITSPGFTDSRIMKAAEQNGLLVATQIVSNAAGNLDNAAWYVFNVSSGTPTLQQQGAVSGGPGVYITYPGIDINPKGDIGMSYMQSGTAPGQFLSVYVTGRTPSDAPGTMEAPVLVQAGAGNYVEDNSFFNPSLGFIEYRLGDMSGINVDSDGSFWIANEYANTDAHANWGTAIGHFTLESPISVVLTSATEGQPLTNVPVAIFTDNSGAPLGSYVATIFWGDGSMSVGQVVADSNGTFTVLGTHTYLEEGQYPLTVSVRNATTNLGSASGIVTVADAPLLGSAQVINSQAGTFASNALVAVFTDTDTTIRDPSQYTATIQWFEGNGLSFTSSGSIVRLFGNTFAVYSSSPFSFPVGGLFTVRAVIRDIGGASVTVDSTVNVAHNPSIPPLIPQYAADAAGPVTSPYAAMQDALTNLLTAERLFLLSLVFGTAAEQQHGFANLMNAFTAYQTAIFVFDMSLPGSS
jgi:hypothetical protein